MVVALLGEAANQKFHPKRQCLSIGCRQPSSHKFRLRNIVDRHIEIRTEKHRL